jgi:PPP family 3-phenylpropionic acid transporter
LGKWENLNKFWPFTFNFLLFSAGASVLPFVVLYYQELGFTGAQIGVITGITPLITFFIAPLWSGIADATGRHRLIMSFALLGGAVALIVYPFLFTFLPVLLIAVAFYFFLAPVIPFADSATMFMLADEKEMYGRIRLGGTIGYGLAAPIVGGLVQNYSLRIAFWGASILLITSLIVSQKLVYGKMKAERSTRGGIRIILSNPRWLLFLILAFVGGLALAAFNNYFFPYMKEVGASESMMGLALTVGTISEVPVLFFGNKLIKQFKAYGLLMLSMIVTGLRLILFAVAGTTTLVMLIQIISGLTFAAFWIAGVSYADENAPPGMRTTAQGLFSAMVMGIGTAVGGFIGGMLLESIGGRDLYLTFGITVLIIVTIVSVIYSRMPEE